MKYIRILILFLLLVLVGIGVYYLYLILSANKPAETSDFETATPFNVAQNTASSSARSSKVSDYTSADLATSGKIVRIQGHFQAIDPVEKTINDIVYSRVMGILDDRNVFSRIWLTANEYGEVNRAISDNNILLSHTVVLTLSRDGASLEKISP